MNFRDLTARAVAAIKRKPVESAKTPLKGKESRAAGNEVPAKSKTS
ncbi:hypothetical protein C8D95_107180 [Silicimonas algicola]|uniref:Uncharacterized protein n=1 Tax=Silicimonas algicola TaxID=1826607 RepID=A0A316G3J5_9RHOB|nr:hypothetical protein C8D95_107180 [Silicimonas algicola]